jgi:hypothetical protein
MTASLLTLLNLNEQRYYIILYNKLNSQRIYKKKKKLNLKII